MSVSGILVNASPGDLTALAEELGSLPGVCVHYRDDATGRLIVTLDAASLNEEVEGLRRIQRIDGVVAADLAYHNLQSADRPDAPALSTSQSTEEVIDEHHSS